MNFNVGSLIFDTIKIITGLGSKLYEMLNYPVSLGFLSKMLDFFNINLDLPDTISLITIIGSLGAGAIIIIIIYNIFKL